MQAIYLARTYLQQTDSSGHRSSHAKKRLPFLSTSKLMFEACEVYNALGVKKLCCFLLTLATVFKSGFSLEWNCKCLNAWERPETEGNFTLLTDCVMWYYPITITGDLMVVGRPGLTSINNNYRRGYGGRHFQVPGNTKLTLKRLKLTGGWRTGMGGSGGSIDIRGQGSVLHASSCVFLNNRATWGGAIYGGAGSSITLFESTLRNNTATKGGGVYSVGKLEINVCEFIFNSAVRGAGMCNDGANSITTVINSVFRQNDATFDGGAFYSYGTVNLLQSKILYNRAGEEGGGMGMNGGSLTLKKSLVEGNVVTNPTFYADGGGGLYTADSSIIRIQASMLIKNKASNMRGHQIFTYKHNNNGGVSSVIIVNSKIIPCDSCFTNNFFTFHYDTMSGSEANYDESSRILCSSNPCTEHPYSGTCSDRTEEMDFGVVCQPSSSRTCPSGRYLKVTEDQLPPPTDCQPCVSGKYGNFSDKGVESESCLLCPVGKFGSAPPGQTSEAIACHSSCRPGSYGFTPGKTTQEDACLQCSFPNQCLGGTSCVPWRTGLVCGVCSDNLFSRDSGATCTECPESGFSYVLVGTIISCIALKCLQLSFVSAEEDEKVSERQLEYVFNELIGTLVTKVVEDTIPPTDEEEKEVAKKEAMIELYLTEVWTQYDEDNSGLIDANETKQLLEDFTGHPVPLEDCVNFIAQIDEDGDGTISREELIIFIAYGSSLDWKQREAYGARGRMETMMLSFFHGLGLKICDFSNRKEYLRSVKRDLLPVVWGSANQIALDKGPRNIRRPDVIATPTLVKKPSSKLQHFARHVHALRKLVYYELCNNSKLPPSCFLSIFIGHSVTLVFVMPSLSSSATGFFRDFLINGADLFAFNFPGMLTAPTCAWDAFVLPTFFLNMTAPIIFFVIIQVWRKCSLWMTKRFSRSKKRKTVEEPQSIFTKIIHFCNSVINKIVLKRQTNSKQKKENNISRHRLDCSCLQNHSEQVKSPAVNDCLFPSDRARSIDNRIVAVSCCIWVISFWAITARNTFVAWDCTGHPNGKSTLDLDPSYDCNHHFGNFSMTYGIILGTSLIFGMLHAYYLVHLWVLCFLWTTAYNQDPRYDQLRKSWSPKFQKYGVHVKWNKAFQFDPRTWVRCENFTDRRCFNCDRCDNHERYGWLFAHFHPHFFYWELFPSFGRKILLFLPSLYLTSNAVAANILNILINLSYIGLLMYFQPYLIEGELQTRDSLKIDVKPKWSKERFGAGCTLDAILTVGEVFIALGELIGTGFNRFGVSLFLCSFIFCFKEFAINQYQQWRSRRIVTKRPKKKKSKITVSIPRTSVSPSKSLGVDSKRNVIKLKKGQKIHFSKDSLEASSPTVAPNPTTQTATLESPLSGTAEEVALKEVFKIIDRKNNGEIKISKFLRAIKMNMKVQSLLRQHALLMPLLNARAVETRFKEIDQDGDGVVSVDEVIHFAHTFEEEIAVRQAFSIIDPKNKGEIKISKFLRALKMNMKVQTLFRQQPLLKALLNVKAVETRFKDIDRDGDGVVSVSEVIIFAGTFKVEDEGPQLTFSSSPAEEDAIKEAFGLIDPKNTGEIRIPAFLRSIKMNLKVQALFRKHPLLTPILNTREVVSRFKEFDKDGDGLVSVQEVLQFATSSFIKSHVQLQD